MLNRQRQLQDSQGTNLNSVKNSRKYFGSQWYSTTCGFLEHTRQVSSSLWIFWVNGNNSLLSLFFTGMLTCAMLENSDHLLESARVYPGIWKGETISIVQQCPFFLSAEHVYTNIQKCKICWICCFLSNISMVGEEMRNLGQLLHFLNLAEVVDKNNHWNTIPLTKTLECKNLWVLD